jgi:enoyl-CoA hydratase
LREAFEAFEADEEAHVAVLHGFGGNFCAGYDLEELAGLDKDQVWGSFNLNTCLSNHTT